MVEKVCLSLGLCFLLASCDKGGPEEGELAPADAHTVKNAKRIFGEKNVGYKAKRIREEEAHKITAMFPQQHGSARCGDRSLEVDYDPYRRVLKLVTQRNNKTYLSEGWTRLSNEGERVFERKFKDDLGLMITDPSKTSVSFTLELDHKDEVAAIREKLLPEGQSVSLKLDFDTVVAVSAGDEKYENQKETFGGIQIELYSFSKEQAQQLRDHRAEVSEKHAWALAYAESSEGENYTDLEAIDHPDAKAIVDDFQARKKAAEDAAAGLPDTPFAEHKDALKVSMTCE